MTARNCEKYVAASLESVSRQTHERLHVLFVDDASTDGTGKVARRQLEKLFPGRHSYVRNQEPWGKARNAHVHLRAGMAEDDFVAVVDADDQVIEPTILAQFAAHYSVGSDVVWTNFVTDFGSPGCCGPLDPLLPPRIQGWRTSHFFSFRGALLSNVPEQYFQDGRGNWLTAACDMALAMPILDQTRRYTFLPVLAYRYTATNPQSHHNLDPQSEGLNSSRQKACAREVQGKRPLPCTRPAMAGGATEEEVLRSLRDHVTREVEYAQERIGRLVAAAAWHQAAAQRLLEECPRVFEIVMAQPGLPLEPLQLLSMWRLFQALPHRLKVLEIGAGSNAEVLAAFTGAREGEFHCVTADPDRAEALRGNLQAHPGNEHAHVLQAPNALAEWRGLRASLPDLSVLGDASEFDLVAIAAEPEVLSAAGAILSMPVCAKRLSRRGFIFCLFTESLDRQRQVAEACRLVTPDLSVTVAGCAGHALVVKGDA